jgi:hypothetical protein
MASVSPMTQAVRITTPAEQAWRVIRLLNVFRLLVPLVLLMVFFFDAPTRSVGSQLGVTFVTLVCRVHFFDVIEKTYDMRGAKRLTGFHRSAVNFFDSHNHIALSLAPPRFIHHRRLQRHAGPPPAHRRS